jgi:rhodanese-related sulfurtransferase
MAAVAAVKIGAAAWHDTRIRASREEHVITTGYKALVAAAEAEIETIPVEEAIKLLGASDVQFVDIRDVRELWRDGTVPGAFHAPRGLLEFWVDPESPYYKELFGSDKKFVFFCAGGLRSALATHTVQRMGLRPVAHIAGGFEAWVKAGGPIERRDPKPAKPTQTSGASSS